MSEETKSIKINPTYNKVVKNYNKSFSMYAETDLDQPTDYSLRYAEDDSDSSDSDDCNKISKNPTTATTTPTTTATTTTVTTTTSTKNEFVQDTIKTYCTEDTPYETPFNFSTATSMSDLRIDDKPNDKLDNNDVATHNKVVLNDSKIVKSEFSSGLMSPEKPINYCEEGTPGYFSRVPSFSSLNSVTVNENESTTITKIDRKIETKIKETKRNEVKAVKFEEVVNYAEETPLMFSRSSSLASLDSIEQHSIHDDRSSVISDFSRLTSGLVSPSELPDSPTQTIPPSPKLRQSKQQKHPTVADTVVEASPKGNIFEDSVKKFKLESTPIQFSRATSLSSLTIDEHDGNDRQQTQEQEENQQESIEEEQESQLEDEEVKIEEKQEEVQENLENQIEEKLDLNDNNENSESEEEDEDMLAACINIGIQNNRYSQKSNRSSPDLPTFNYPKNQLNDLNQRWVVEEDKKNIPLNSVDSKLDLNISLETNLGNSNQSLSSLSDDDDDTSSESGGAALLEECILAGMPKKCDTQTTNLSIKSNELTEAEQQLLEQCILDGMKKSRLSPKKQLLNQHKHNQLTNDLTESERSLLQQCIMAGMQKNNNNNNHNNNHRHHRPSTSKDQPELTSTERQLLEQCILDGMPKNNRSINNNRPINSRRIRDYERLNQQTPPVTTTTQTTEHTCCIHCPRNQQKQLLLKQNQLRMKKKFRNHERTQQIHLRDNKDYNILYVTSQILALKKEMIDRSHEEWV